MSKETQKEWREANKEYIAEYRRRDRLGRKSAGREAQKKYRLTDKGKKSKEKHESKAKKKYLEKPVNKIRTLLRGAQRRSEISGTSFDSRLYAVFADSDSVPLTCPCCGAVFDFTFGGRRLTPDGRSFSPSIDRVDNSKGYTTDNVMVICTRCNLAKGASNLADLERLVEYVKIHGNSNAVESRRVESQKAVEAYERRARIAKKVEEKPFIVLTLEERQARREEISAGHRARFAAMTPEERKELFALARQNAEAYHKAREIERRGDLGPLDWSTVNWSFPNLFISRKENVALSRVQKMRKMFGQPAVDGRKFKE